jgi:hypothetical protein
MPKPSSRQGTARDARATRAKPINCYVAVEFFVPTGLPPAYNRVWRRLRRGGPSTRAEGDVHYYDSEISAPFGTTTIPVSVTVKRWRSASRS